MGVSAEDPALAFRDLVQELVDANLAREPERAMRVSKREAAALVATLRVRVPLQTTSRSCTLRV